MPELPESVATPVAQADEADEVLLASVDLARRALLEVTPPETVGGVLGHLVEGDHLLTLLFAADLRGYPGWHWSVTIVRVDDGEPTVLETELMPGDAALLAPEWVPWSERLADYRAAQEAIAATAAEAGETESGDELAGLADDLDEDEEDEDDDDDDVDDVDDLDEDEDVDDDDHDDDVVDEFDGIDIDALDDSIDDESDEGDDGDEGDDLAPDVRPDQPVEPPAV